MTTKTEYYIHDMNGFQMQTLYTEVEARQRAKQLAYDTGLDMQICFERRIGRMKTFHVINVRSQNRKLLMRRHYTTQGQAFIAKSSV